MTVFVMFFLELMAMRYAKFGPDEHDLVEPGRGTSTLPINVLNIENANKDQRDGGNHVPGEDHLGHSREHTDNEDVSPDWKERGIVPESYAAQLTAIFILEFGVVFHSIFVGLTLAVSGNEFTTLYIVIVFHQTFEGLGLGSRLASIPWPRSKRWTPYILASVYGLSTPIAISIGLGVRNGYSPNSPIALIVNGVFDSISAGILLYTGLVELMAHEFMFSNEMSKAPIKVVLAAFGLMCLGAALMALLGKWA
jgi:zinc transporter 1/2/3